MEDKENTNNKNNKKKRSVIKTSFIWILLFFIAIYSGAYISNTLKKNVTYTELVREINKGTINKIEILPNGKTVKIIGKDNFAKEVEIPSMDVFLESIKEKTLKDDGTFEITQVKEPLSNKVLSVVLPYLPFFILSYFLLYFLKGIKTNANNMMGKGEPQFGKNKAKLVEEGNKPKERFSSVAGVDEEKAELEEIVDFLKNPQKYTEMGARIPKGVLLVGRPGTGKTLLAKAVAGEADVPFFSISGSDFVELYVGVGASRVRDLFTEAKKKAPSIIFIDEIDAVGRQRGAGIGGGHDEREQTLNQLLVEMDGFEGNVGVIVIAATNRPDILDSALLRAGRFDRQIMVSPPDIKAREEILKVHAKNKKMADDVDIEVVAKNTSGMVGADLENILNEAALIAAKTGEKAITSKLIEEAMVKVMMGPEKKSRVMNEKEKNLVSYHEAGHAVASYFLPTQEKVHQISIVPRGAAGGFTMYKAGEDKSFMSKKEMEESIIALLGGRIAEAIILEDISTGASNDIERATKIAKSMVTKYGMSEKIGAVSYESDTSDVFLGRDIGQHKVLSDSTASIIDSEVKRIIDTAYDICYEILEKNKDKLHKIAKVLKEKEKIEGEEFAKIMEEK